MHWFLPPLFLLIISQGALAQYPCDSPDAVKIPVSVPWLTPAAGANLGYMWDPDPTLGINKERIPVCLFTANQTFLEQCGSTTTLYQNRDGFPPNEDTVWMGITYLEMLKSSKPIGVTFQTPENVCGLDLQPMYDVSPGNNFFTLSIGTDYDELIDLGYVSAEFLGYSIPCDDMKDQVICAKKPTKSCTKKWSEWEWAPGSMCNDTCGNCGSRARQRTCLTSGCTGAAEDTVSCGNPVCMSPRMSCCGSYVVKVDEATSTHVCG